MLLYILGCISKVIVNIDNLVKLETLNVINV